MCVKLTPIHVFYNVYVENVALSSKRKELMRVKKKRIRLKCGHVVKTYTSKKIVCVEITTHTSKIWPCRQKENNLLCVLKKNEYV